MTDKNLEMSLDDVLSSIRKMMIDDEPPVLDLTDMVKPDGSIVKIKNTENTDMGAFLKFVQENSNSTSGSASASALNQKHLKEDFTQQLKTGQLVSADISSCPVVSSSERKVDKNEAILELLKELSEPLISKWINDNLPDIAKRSEPLINKWISDNLPDIAKRVIEERVMVMERKIRDLLEKYPI
ncbi:MAG: hypothetical protein LBB21_01685 [Holosporaceae bacterium]|jgi:cell pole-organizing protein PopZ|nr:hypothetical protein [Holosporaceae bacterium]